MTKKKMGLLSTVFIGISSIIGSGSLFVPYKAAVIAGPAAIIAWTFCGGLILLLALCLAEVASLYPKRGLAAAIPTLSHNKFFGFPFAIANWLGVVAVIGLEADATIQYLINLIPHLQTYFYENDQLTLSGNLLSIFLVVIYWLINYWGAKILVKANNILAILKILIPTISALTIIAVAFHPHHFTLVNNQFIPYGYNSILLAVLMSGIFVSFNGFQSIVSFSSEIENPKKNIFVALFFSIIFCLAVYILLQVAFISAIPTPTLISKGWSQIQMSAPMVELAGLLGLNLLTSIIYFGAIVIPSGAGIAFMGSAGRMLTAMSRNAQMPKFLGKLHPKYHVSRLSLLTNTALAIIFLLIFRSWSQLAEFLSLVHIISYLPIPIALCVFRKTHTKDQYFFRVWAAPFISLALFVTFTYLFILGHPSIINEILISFTLLQIIYIGINERSWIKIFSAIKQCLGIAIYFLGLWALNHISHTYYRDSINTKPFIFIVIGFSLISFYGLTRYQINTSEIDDKIFNSNKVKSILPTNIE